MNETTQTKQGSLLMMLSDPATPEARKRDLLRMLMADTRPEAAAVLQEVFSALCDSKADEVVREKGVMLAAVLKEMGEGPSRVATFVHLAPPNGAPVHHAQLILEDGTIAFVVVPDVALAQCLAPGDRVVIEAQGRAVLRRFPAVSIGEEARLERRVDAGRVAVSLRGNDRHVFLAAKSLTDKLDRGELTANSPLIVNVRHGFAYDGLPPEDGFSHYRYLDRAAPPDVVVERDIGAPPACIGEIEQMVRMEMTQVEMRRRYRLPSCATWLFAGVSGSGKTFAIQGIWRRVYEIMRDVTGMAIEDLPPRVFRLRPSEVFSKWFGESDKNLERFFDEVEAMAGQKFEAPNGTQSRLPVLVVLEELDGIGRARGQEPIYDRVLTTALRRLDPSRTELSRHLIIFLATTNEPQLIDRALFRRAGGKVVRFGRLKRQAFRAVLARHVSGRPIASDNGTEPAHLEEHLVNCLTDWLFSANGSDRGLVEINYIGSNQPDVRHRRDFLTGSIVESAVREAAEAGCRAELKSTEAADRGLTVEGLVKAFDEQVRGLAEQVSEQNAGHYLDLPDAARVASVRRLPQPALFPMLLPRPATLASSH